MKEAKKRNPEIKLYGLAWTAPGWCPFPFFHRPFTVFSLSVLSLCFHGPFRVGDGEYFSQDNIDCETDPTRSQKFCTDSEERVWEGCGKTVKRLDGLKSDDTGHNVGRSRKGSEEGVESRPRGHSLILDHLRAGRSAAEHADIRH